MITGACNCGAVQFEIDAALSGVFVCHCSICRRSTGSNGIATVKSWVGAGPIQEIAAKFGLAPQGLA